jgi:cobalt-zinc-cadmium efflux system membrane fusion protein
MSPTAERARARAYWVLILALGIGVPIVGCGRGTETATEEHADEHAGEHADEHGAIELSLSAIRNAGIRTGVAGSAPIQVGTDSPGEVHLNAERVLEVRPRYPGVVREIRVRVGDATRNGQVVAVVQSNESLADYDITSSMDGSVIARHVVPGQAVDHQMVLLTVADLSTVWVEFAIYPQFVGRIREGMPATVTVQDRPDLRVEGTVRYVGPLLEQDTRVSSGRIQLPNPARKWQPGMFVTVHVVLEQARVPVAVPDEAVVRTAEGPAVFRVRGSRFELEHVRVGRSDGETTEIVEGLAAGDSIAVAGAFVLKSELGKGEVEHEH